MKGLPRKLTALFVMLTFLVTSVIPAFAQSEDISESVGQELAGAPELVAKYPNGLFSINSAGYQTTEGEKFEVQVVRQGGVEGEVSVDFKAIDVSAKYGEDYVIIVKEGLFPKTLPENKNAVPLIESGNVTIRTLKDEEEIEEIMEKYVENEEEPAVEVDLGKGTIEQGSEAEADSRQGSSNPLMEAKERYTGVKSDRKTIKDFNDVSIADEESKNETKAQLDAFYNVAEGVEHTLVFKPGERIKTVTVEIIDDDVAENDEQVLFVLKSAQGGAAISDSTGVVMNIVDNEEMEESVFSFGANEQVVQPGEKARVIVKRTKGINTYAKVDIMTYAIDANPDLDYMTLDETLIFTPKEEEKVIEIQTYKTDGTLKNEVSFGVRFKGDVTTEAPARTKVVISPYLLSDEDSDDASMEQKGYSSGRDKYILQPSDFTAAWWWGPGFSGGPSNFWCSKDDFGGLFYRFISINFRKYQPKASIDWKSDASNVDYGGGCGEPAKGFYVYNVFQLVGNPNVQDTNGDMGISLARNQNFGRRTDTLTWSDSKMGSNYNRYLRYGSWYDYKDDSNLTVYSITLYRRLFEVVPQAAPNLYYRTYTASNRYQETTSINPGSFTFTQTDYYSDETVTLSYSLSSSDVQYVGFQIQDKYDSWGGIITQSGNGITRGNPDRIQISGDFLNKYMDSHGKPSSKSGDGRRFNVRPVFELKPAKFSIEYDSSKFTVPGFNSKEVVNVRFGDTVKINATVNPDTTEAIRAFQIYKDGKLADTIYTTISTAYDFKIDAADYKVKILSEPRGFEAKPYPGITPPAGATVSPSKLENLKPNQVITITANAPEGYTTRWYIRTGDLNGNGELEWEEVDRNRDGQPDPEFRISWEKRHITYTGNVFHFKVEDANPLVYYRFEKIGEGTPITTKPIFGTVTKKVASIRNAYDVKYVGVPDVQVMIDYFSAVTDKNGNFMIKPDPATGREFKFINGEQYPARIMYGGSSYTTYFTPGAGNQWIELPFFESIIPKSIEARVDGILQQGNIEIRDKNIEFLVQTQTTDRNPGKRLAKVSFRVYSKDKVLKHEYTVGEKQLINGTDAKWTTNLANTFVAGDTLSVALYDQFGEEIGETDTGYSFYESPGRNTALPTFAAKDEDGNMIQNEVPIFGNTQANFPMGTQTDTNKAQKEDEPSGTITITIGIDGDKLDEVKELAEKLKPKKEGDTPKPSSEDLKKAKEIADKGNNKPDGGKSSVSTETSPEFEFEISFVLQMKLVDGKVKFQSLVLCASVEAGLSVTVTVVVYGVPLYMTFGGGGSVMGLFAVCAPGEKLEEMPDFVTDKMDEILEKMYVTGLLQVSPWISIEAGVGQEGIGKVGVEGKFEVELTFVFVPVKGGEGTGTISANLKIEFLFFEFDYKIASYKFDMFKYGAAANVLNNGLSQAFDVGEEALKPASRDYLANGKKWVANESMSTKAGLGEVETKTIVTGTYNNTEPKLMAFKDSEGNEKLLLAYIDDVPERDEYNRTAAYITVYDGTKWSEPVIIDDDGTIDADIYLFDLDDEIMIAWSDASRTFTAEDKVSDILSAMNICTTTFNKATGQLSGNVQQVTKETELDTCADTLPRLAKDTETGKVILYYTKTLYQNKQDNPDGKPVVVPGDEFEPVNPGNTIGDLVTAYTAIAYRFYENGKWNEGYDEGEFEDMTPEELEEYTRNWYGQRFLDAGIPNVVNDPKIEESSVVYYNGLSLYAYTVDLDQDTSSPEKLKDQEIFVQIYNFSENSFSHPIRFTNNNVRDYNPQMARYKDRTYLFWVSGDRLVYVDLTTLIKNANPESETSTIRLINIDGKEVYVLSDNFAPEVAMEGIGDTGFGDNYKVAVGQDGNLYLVWTQKVQTVKDGIDPDSIEAEKYENTVQERQFFAAMFEDGLVDLPSTGNDNRRIGIWGLPNQITFAKGANYSGHDFVVLEDGTMVIAHNSYKQKLDENGIMTRDVTTNKLEVSTLKPVSTVGIKPEDIVIGDKYVLPGMDTTITATAKNTGLKAARSMEFIFSQVLDGVETEIGRNKVEGYIPGGKSVTVETDWKVPENFGNEDLKIKVEVIEDGMSDSTVVYKQVPIRAYAIADGVIVRDTFNDPSNLSKDVYMDILEYVQSGNYGMTIDERFKPTAVPEKKNTFLVAANIMNIGNKAAKKVIVSVYIDKLQLTADAIEALEQKGINLDAPLATMTIENMPANSQETVAFNIEVDDLMININNELPIKFVVETVQMDEESDMNIMEEVEEEEDKYTVYTSGKQLQQVSQKEQYQVRNINVDGEKEGIKTRVGDNLKLNISLVPDTAIVANRIEYESSDPSVLQVNEDGTITGKSVGTATLTIKAVPDVPEYINKVTHIDEHDFAGKLIKVDDEAKDIEPFEKQITVEVLPEGTQYGEYFNLITQFKYGSEKATRLEADKVLSAEVRAENVSGETMDAMVIVALYDSNNRMTNVSFIAKTINPGQAEIMSAGFTLPSDVSRYNAKVFVWKGLDLRKAYIPLTGITEINTQGIIYPPLQK
ncbi:MAG: hypothetical protein GX066_02915 [Clostridiaceae bacterium]|nr:hypothetical protein [Clostridiaceae bacterium]